MTAKTFKIGILGLCPHLRLHGGKGKKGEGIDSVPMCRAHDLCMNTFFAGTPDSNQA
jgi:hypothetical protein